MKNKYNYQILHLSDEQKKAVLKKIAFAVANLMPDELNLKTDLEKLDYSWNKLIENAASLDIITIHTVLNSLGSYLGELFKGDFPLFEWKLFQDKMGSDLCLYFDFKGKDILIYPISSLYKGFEARDKEFLITYFNQTKEEILKWMAE